MSKNNGPWGTENPWSSTDNDTHSPKVVDFKIKKPQNFDFKIGWIFAAIALLWLATGFYQVQPNEQGVVLRFGKYTYTTDAGLHYHLPYPIEKVIKVSITQERSINLGVAEAYTATNRAAMRNGKLDMSDPLKNFTESHMLTGDENIVDVNLTVVWRIKDAKDYLFSMQDPDTTTRVAAQSVLREIVGQSEMQAIITGDRGKLRGLNVVGLKRSGIDEHTVKAISRAFMYIFKGKEDTFDERVEKAKTKFADNAMVMEQLAFIEASLHGRRKIMTAE